MTGRRGRRRKQLRDELNGKRRHWDFKEEESAGIPWGIRFVRGYGLVARETME